MAHYFGTLFVQIASVNGDCQQEPCDTKQVPVRKRSARSIWLAAVVVLAAVSARFAFPAFRRSQNPGRLVEAVLRKDAAEVRTALAEGADPNALLESPFSLSLTNLIRMIFHLRD